MDLKDIQDLMDQWDNQDKTDMLVRMETVDKMVDQSLLDHQEILKILELLV